jgi:choline-sulfatase/uncharacterized sulfatase
VIYSSDHGDFACEHGQMEKAPGICSDAITRIPFLWRWPGRFPAGHVCNELVEAVDMVNTVCGLAGLPLMATADGKDLANLLRGGRGAVRDMAVTEFPWSRSVYRDRYRLVYYPPDMFAEEYPRGFGELYDLEKDPWEMHNLYFEPAFRQTVRDMERALLDWLVTTTRPATVHPLRPAAGRQVHTRYGHSVNADGKVHPDRVRAIAGSNYV